MRAGLKADPDAPFVPTFLASQMLNVGRFGEALELARKSLTDQPYQPHKLRRVIKLSILLGYDDIAEPLFAKARRWWPDHADIYWDRIVGYALVGDLPGADRAIADTPGSASGFDRKASGRLMAAWRSGEANVVREVCTQASARYVTQMLCLSALRKFGDRDTAFRVADAMFPRLSTGSASGDERVWLDDPYADFDPMLSSPAMTWLRSDPRYLPLVERMGLLAYWRTGAMPDFCKRAPEPVCATIPRRPD